jgi:hypothetical protein
MTIAKRPPSFIKQIRKLIAKCEWPEGAMFAVDANGLLGPDGYYLVRFIVSPITETERARCEFIAAACSHFILEQQLERKAAAIATGEVGKSLRTREQKP